MRVRVSAVALFLLAACAEEAKKPEAAADEKPKVVKASAATLAPPVAAAATDRFASRYEEIRSMLTRWDGDATKIDLARARLKEIVAEDRSYAPAYVGLARCETLGGYDGGVKFESAALDRAEKFVNHAIRLQPESFDAHIERAWIMRYRGDFDLAEESLRRAEELKPGHPEIKLVRAGIALEQSEDIQGATRLAREVVAQATDDDLRARAYSFLVFMYEAFAHKDEADAAHRELVRLRPQSAWAHGNYAGFLLRRDDVDGAIREGEAALRIRKYKHAEATLARAYLSKAQQLWDESRIQESASYVEKVRVVAGDKPELMFALGQFYEGAAIRGRDASMRKKALESYRRALELDPRHAEAERAVARLER